MNISVDTFFLLLETDDMDAVFFWDSPEGHSLHPSDTLYRDDQGISILHC